MSTGASWDGAPETSSPDLRSLRRVAYWLDSAGLDPLLGLIPGAGDAAGAVLALWIFVAAVRAGASRATLLRIAGNVALDAVIGAIPIVGDIFDFLWKANLRNMNLLQRHLAAPDQARRADRWFVMLLGGGVALFVVSLAVLGLWLLRWAARASGV